MLVDKTLLRFKELKADPSKALKPHHRPHNAHEFAEKYLQGYYTLTGEEAEADSKDNRK